MNSLFFVHKVPFFFQGLYYDGKERCITCLSKALMHIPKSGKLLKLLMFLAIFGLSLDNFEKKRRRKVLGVGANAVIGFVEKTPPPASSFVERLHIGLPADCLFTALLDRGAFEQCRMRGDQVGFRAGTRVLGQLAPGGRGAVDGGLTVLREKCFKVLWYDAGFADIHDFRVRPHGAQLLQTAPIGGRPDVARSVPDA
ncbi:hypothetical protein [Salipiger sp. IMCC34102]|uniref:hypothetical protein n=1 Tax=Salipiger sp. IMCC34102 TaxID=2510647 RepID=UPI0013EDE172|nr:hypothetical protein [Salipiger sp. IMCC34102]